MPTTKCKLSTDRVATNLCSQVSISSLSCNGEVGLTPLPVVLTVIPPFLQFSRVTSRVLTILRIYSSSVNCYEAFSSNTVRISMAVIASFVSIVRYKRSIAVSKHFRVILRCYSSSSSSSGYYYYGDASFVGTGKISGKIYAAKAWRESCAWSFWSSN